MSVYSEIHYKAGWHNYYNKKRDHPTYPSITEVFNGEQGSLLKTWKYQMYWIYFLHKLYSVQVKLVVLPTPPLQKSTMMSPGRWIASTAVARFSSCWHFLWWRFFGRSTNVYIQLSKKKLFFRRWICKNEEYFSIHFAWMFVALQHLKSP